MGLSLGVGTLVSDDPCRLQSAETHLIQKFGEASSPRPGELPGEYL